MFKQLANWKGKVNVNGVEYMSVADVPELDMNATTVITLIPNVIRQKVQMGDGKVEHVITVKQYMTKTASPDFDFMAKWNNNVPMPMRTMVGTIEKETRGMVYMKLHGQGLRTITCLRCGRELTHPISRHHGIGPECIQKLGMCYSVTDVDKIKEALVNVTWEGWVIRSSIVKDEILGVSND